jgi:hypothetical protein
LQLDVLAFECSIARLQMRVLGIENDAIQGEGKCFDVHVILLRA